MTDVVDDHEHRSTRHKRRHEDDVEKHSKKHSKHDKDKKEKKRHKSEKAKKVRVHDEEDDEDVWVEKNIDMDGERPLATEIPSAESLKLKSRAAELPNDPPLPVSKPTESKLVRDEWMLLPPSAPSVPAASDPGISRLHAASATESLTEDYGDSPENGRTLGGGVDFFSSLGTEKRKKPKDEKADEKPKVSSRELNQNLVQGISLADYPHEAPKAAAPGSAGSSWRMMKLRRVFETAEEEGKSVEEVALERFGSLEAFEEAKEERRILDERGGRRMSKGGQDRRRDDTPGSSSREQRYMFTDTGASGGMSRSSSFRRPGESTPSTPSPASGPSASSVVNKRVDALRLPPKGSPLSMSHTPVPTVMTPPPMSASGKKALSTEDLNRLQAKVLRAKLMGSPDAERLEKEYEEEQRRSQGILEHTDEDGKKIRTRIEALPTLDVRGRLYDVGTGQQDSSPSMQGNRKKKADKFETRDAKTGELIRYNADDDEQTLGEMLRNERFGAGMADQKNLDAELAAAITRDGKFEDDLEYMDDNAEKLGRKKMRDDAMKRQFAINDYKRTQKVLATCPFCYGEDDSLPKAPVVAMATRCYLSCTLNQELTEGHCLIVPIQHHLTMLEADDDVWDEVRNFMKCLMRMFAEQDKAAVFYETVISLRHQNHTYIECVPLPWDMSEDAPAYFKESIMMAETEWSTHKKLIDFSARPGGFRRALVKELPYFMVQFDYKGEKGYGHVIEGTGEAAGGGEGDGAIDEGEKGGGEFPRYFAAEILGNMLDVEPRRWRRPKRIDFRNNRERVAAFKKGYHKFDWTSMIGS